MNKKQAIKILELYRDKIGWRDYIAQPFKQKGNYFATDGKSLICFPENVAILKYENQERPDAMGIIPPITDNQVKINVDDFKRLVLDHTPMTDEYEIESSQCEECYGHGDVECDLGHEHECEECKGKGKIEGSKPTGKKILDKSRYYEFLGVCLQYKYLQQLFQACKILGVSEIKKQSGDTAKALFDLGVVKILIMGVGVADDNNVIKLPELQKRTLK